MVKEYQTNTKAKADKIAKDVRARGYRATVARPYVVYQWGKPKKVRITPKRPRIR